MADDQDDDRSKLQRERAVIDALDAELLRLISERARRAQAIGALKEGPAYRPEREAQVLRRVQAENPGPLSGDAVSRVFREIMSACLALEQKLSVSYLGPPGTYSHSAVTRHFGDFVVAEPCASIDEVFRAAEGGRTDYAIVPVENSTEGAVGRTLDLMAQTPLTIVGEVKLRIVQNLLAKGGTLDAVSRVYSHAQSLAQCVQWLALHLPAVPRVAVASNAEAARRAAEEPASAAVAGEMAAEHYKLEILASNIEDEPNNTTRFLVLGDYQPKPSGRDKTSLILSARNRAGAVYEMLTPFATRGVSMTKFESRPSRVALWEYLFFVDIEGHRDDGNVADALEEVNRIAGYLKVLGSYPAAVL